MQPIRVVVWGLGSMGSLMASILDEKEGVEIVGAADSHPEKTGRTLGELFGLKRFPDVVVTDGATAPLPEADVALLAVSSFISGTEGYIRELVGSGTNVITIAEEWTYPWRTAPETAAAIDGLAKAHGVTVLGTGVNPGFVLDLLIIAMTGACLKVNRIEARRINDLSPFGKTVMETQGVGTSPEEFRKGIEKGDIVGHIGFQQSIAMIGNALGWEIDRIEESREPIISNTERKTAVAHVKPGMVAGCKHVGRGYCGDKLMIELVHPQQILPETEGVDTGDYIDIYGDPEIHLSIKPEIPGGKGTIALATNMIPAVIEAAPGLLEMSELPIPRCLIDEIKEM